MPYEFLNIIYFIFTANLLLQDTIERIQVGKKYGDIYRGIFLIRGENVVLVGEFVSSLLHYLIHVHFFYVYSIEPCFSYWIWQDGSADEKTQMIKVDVEEILEAQRSDQIAKDERERALVKARLQLGMHVNLPDSYIVSKDDFGT